MSTVREDLERFQHFVDERLARESEDTSLDELFGQWQDSLSREENTAFRRGLADVNAGRLGENIADIGMGKA